MTKNLSRTIYGAIFLGGFLILAIQLLVIDLLGISTQSISIIISIALLSLSIGFYSGGGGFKREDYFSKFLFQKSVMNRLGLNAFLVYIIIHVGFDYFSFSEFAKFSNISNYELNLAIYLTIYFAPIFVLLGQFLPLLSTLFDGEGDFSELSGHLMFVSTLGSFVGSLTTSFILIPNLCIKTSLSIIILILVLLIFFTGITKKKH